MKERPELKRRAIKFRARGKRGTWIAAHLCVGQRTLRRWLSEDVRFKVLYDMVYLAWRNQNRDRLREILAINRHYEELVVEERAEQGETGKPRPVMHVSVLESTP